MKPIYLDYNSTAPIAPEVAQTMAECYAEGFVNPASQHRPGQAARRKLESCRTSILELVGGVTSGMRTDQLLFTSGGTESNNLAVVGLAGDSPGRICVSAVEHPSILGIGSHMARLGFDVRTIPVDRSGVVDLIAFRELISHSDTRLVCVMLANNETGVIQPVQEMAALCKEQGIRIHCDAVQGVGKLNVNFRDLDVDSMSFTAHKFHGPRGIGALVLRPGIELRPILFGGFQQMAMRPGTEDVALAVGMHRALELCVRSLDARAQHMSALRDRLESSLSAHVPDLVVNGAETERVPHTLNLSFPGINRQEFLMAADMDGLAISTGSACASGSSDPSHVLIAMNAENEVVEGSIRVSLGHLTTEEEITETTSRMIAIYERLKR